MKKNREADWCDEQKDRDFYPARPNHEWQAYQSAVQYVIKENTGCLIKWEPYEQKWTCTYECSAPYCDERYGCVTAKTHMRFDRGMCIRTMVELIKEYQDETNSTAWKGARS